MVSRKLKLEETEEAADKHTETTSFLCSLDPDNSIKVDDRCIKEPIKEESNGSGFYLRVMRLFNRKK